MKTNEPTTHGDAQNMKSRQHHKSDTASHGSRPSPVSSAGDLGSLCPDAGMSPRRPVNHKPELDDR